MLCGGICHDWQTRGPLLDTNQSNRSGSSSMRNGTSQRCVCVFVCVCVNV